MEKYNCEQCGYKTNLKSRWTVHINTELHKTGQRKKRSDCKEPVKCEHCDYKTKNNTSMKKHILNKHSDKDKREENFIFYCKFCDFGCFYVDIIKQHNETTKHKYNEIVKCS